MFTFNRKAAEAAPVATNQVAANQTVAKTAIENTTPVKSNQTTYGAIEQLATERKAWQEGAFRTSNDQLYGILKNCLKLYNDMCGDKDAAKLLRETLAKYISENKIAVKDSAHTMTKIVRCVFGNDRRRVSAYSIVLRAALVADISVDDLPEYIRSNGGVEEVRLAKSPNYVSPKAKAQVATNWLSDVNLAVVKSDALSIKLDGANVGSQHVLIVTQQADGTLIANAFVSSQSVITSALASVYSANKSQKAAEKATADTSKTDTDLSGAINQAAQKAA